MAEAGDLFGSGGTPGGDDETRLRPRDRRFFLLCAIGSAIALAIGFLLYPHVNPEASIRFDVSRQESARVAGEFLARAGVDVGGFRHATSFTFDEQAKVFLERTVGPSAANALMTGPVRQWRWGNRWFRPLEREEVVVEVATTGGIAAFAHTVPEEAPGADLPAEEAMDRAHALLAELDVDLAALEFLDARSERRPNRTDHAFTWRRSGIEWGGGDYRIEVRIQGDRPGGYREFVHVPES